MMLNITKMAYIHCFIAEVFGDDIAYYPELLLFFFRTGSCVVIYIVGGKGVKKNHTSIQNILKMVY